MSGYTRQQTYIDGDVILAEHTNDEFDLLAEVFDTSLGHRHDGTTAEGPTISLLSDADGDTKIQVEEGANDNIIRFDTLGVERLIIDNSGTIVATGDAIFNGTVDMNSTVTVDGATTFSTRPAFNGGTTGVDSPFSVDSTFLVTNLNAEYLDNFTGQQYLRSDVADQVDGVLTYTSIPVFNGGTSGVSAPFTVDSTFLVSNLNADLLDGNEATAFLGVSAKAADSELLDGLDSSQFVRSDTTDTVAGVLTFSAIPAFNGGTSGASAPFTTDSTFLVTNLNSDLLDGQHGSYYAALGEDETVTGSWAFSNPATFNGSLVANFTTSFNSNVSFTSGSIPAFNGGTTGVSAPFTVDSTFLVTNLNADLLDGVQGANYARTDINETFNGDIILSGSNSQFIGQSNSLNDPSVPSFTWAGQDAKTGMYLIANNTIGFSTDATERVRIDSSGLLHIGTEAILETAGTSSGCTITTLGRVLSANDTTSTCFTSNKTDYVSGSTNHVAFRENGVSRGSITSNGTNTAYNTSSDYRLKENVIALTNATSRLKELKPSRFNFIGQEMTVDGFIAHEVQAVVPEAVVGEKDGFDDEGNPDYQQMDASKLIPLLTAALKELIERVEVLEGRG